MGLGRSEVIQFFIHEKTSCLSRKHTLVFVAAVDTSDRGISWTSGSEKLAV